MSLDPEFIKKIQEKKAKREALESKYANVKSGRSSGIGRTTASGGRKAKPGPVYRSVSMLDGHAVIISGDDAKKRQQKGEYKG